MQEGRVSLTGRHSPLTFYVRTLLYMFVALLLRILALLPLAALFAFPAGSPLKWLALLCPAIAVFLVLPLRFSFAEALTQRRRERYFSFDKALGMSRYGEKLAEGLLWALNLIKWSLPLVAMLAGLYLWQANTDAFTLLGSVTQLGAAMSGAWCAVANFFIGIFGGTPLVAKGQIMEGLFTLLGVLGIGVLVMLLGAVRNSAYRYVWVAASDAEKDPRAEARRRLRGRRWEQLGVALLNLVLWAPFLVVVGVTLKGIVSGLADSVMNMMLQKKLLMPDLAGALAPAAFAFFCLYMPLLPARRMLTCWFATRRARHMPQAGKVEIDPAAVPETLAVPTTSSGAPEPAGEATLGE